MTARRTCATTTREAACGGARREEPGCADETGARPREDAGRLDAGTQEQARAGREDAGRRTAWTGEKRRTHWHPAVPGFPVAVPATLPTAVPTR